LKEKNIRDVTSLEDIKLTSNENLKNIDVLQDFLENCNLENARKDEMKGYIDEAFYRFVKTLQMIPVDSKGKLLEIGSNPYYLSTLLKKFRNFELHGCNYFSTPDKKISQTIFNKKYNENFSYQSRLFNIELDEFPYRDENFDFVLFCEVIEHLVSNPIKTLEQIYRILKPKGTLILTTPNVARQSNIDKLQKNENIYDPYSSYGTYGRHNREYTVKEISDLLTNTGFKIKMKFTKFVHIKYPDKDWWKFEDNDNFRGDYIFIAASKKDNFQDYRPNWLFR